MVIRGRAKFDEFIAATLAGQPFDGAQAEVVASYRCPGEMPLQMLEPEVPERETRAVTPG